MDLKRSVRDDGDRYERRYGVELLPPEGGAFSTEYFGPSVHRRDTLLRGGLGRVTMRVETDIAERVEAGDQNVIHELFEGPDPDGTYRTIDGRLAWVKVDDDEYPVDRIVELTTVEQTATE